MTSREIIIKLIDNKSINGEEAYMLLNDIFKGEMVAVNETLKEVYKPSYGSPYVYTTNDLVNSLTSGTCSK